MKQLIYLMGIALTLNLTTTVQAQSPFRIRKAAERKEQKMQNFRQLSQHRTAPMASQRIQPATGEYYSGTSTTPSLYYKYDAWGNETEERNGSTCYVQTWDNSHGYPVMLDYYSYDVNSDGSHFDPYYYQRTTLNADGVRTAIVDEDGTEYTLDAAGRVTHTLRVEEQPPFSGREEVTLTWNGDVPASYKYDVVAEAGGNSETLRMELTNIQMVYQIKPFNAYSTECDEMFEADESGLLFNADGTMSYKDAEDEFSVAVKMRTTVSNDGKTAVMTGTTNGMPTGSFTYNRTDDNGSYTSKEESDGDLYDDTYVYNEYGDLTEDISIYSEDDGTYTGNEKIVYEWTYENHRPLQVKEYQVQDDGTRNLHSTLVFTSWHDGSAISSVETGEARILGATLYTTDGMFVRTLTAEEVTATPSVSTPQSGIYLLRIQTERGTETRKVIGRR